jgi:hypothetical protein
VVCFLLSEWYSREGCSLKTLARKSGRDIHFKRCTNLNIKIRDKRENKAS